MDIEATPLQRFATRAVIAALAFVTIYGLAKAAWVVASTLLVLYLAVILGIGLRGAAEAIARRTPLGVGPALGAVVLLCVGLPVLAGFLLGPQLAEQAAEAEEQLPELEKRLDGWLSRTRSRVEEATGTDLGTLMGTDTPSGQGGAPAQPAAPPRDAGRNQPAAPPQPTTEGKGRGKAPEPAAAEQPAPEQPAPEQPAPEQPAPQAAGQTSAPAQPAPASAGTAGGGGDPAASSAGGGGATRQVVGKLQGGPASQAFGWITGFVGGISQAVLGVLLVSIIGVYLAASPALYQRGLILLVPIPYRARVRGVLSELAGQLRAWIIAQLVAMVIVGVVTTVGLLILGIPIALLLGILAGILDFIPNFGPGIAAVPAILVAAGEGKVAPVIGLYVFVQVAEGWFLRPLIEKRAVDTPPAILLASQVVMGTLIGFMGLLMAPALVVLFTLLIRRFYVEDMLGDDLHDDEEK